MRNFILFFFLCFFSVFSFAKTKAEKRVITCAKQGLLSCLKEEIKKDKHTQFTLDDNNNTLLVLAAANGHNQALRFLSDEWPKWFIANKQGRNALHMAIISNHYDTAQLVVHLVDEDWDSDIKRFVNVADVKELATPLHWAAYRCQRDLYQFLVEYGANPKARDKEFRTPEDILAACPPEKTKKESVSDNKKAS